MSEVKDLICFRCKHFDQLLGGCAAFENIPFEIGQNGNMHSEPLPGQGNNIVFEPIETDAKE
jgi:hypothetical protein